LISKSKVVVFQFYKSTYVSKLEMEISDLIKIS